MSSQPIDHAARKAAIDPSQSFAVAAPAGSGKTGLLTQRVLSLLSFCDHPEEVLSITFTRKAAAEMQHRINSAIQSAALQEEPPENEHEALTWRLARKVLERDAKLDWQLLKAPNRIRVQTIDGFCRNLARQLPLASGLGALPDTLEQPEIAYAQAVSDIFKQIESDDQLHDHWRRVLFYLDNNVAQLQQLMVSLLGKRDQWLDAVVYLYQLTVADAELTDADFNHQALSHWIEETLQSCRENLSEHGSDLALLADYAASNLIKDGKDDLQLLEGLRALPGVSAEDLGAWQQLASLLLTDKLNKGNWRKSLTKNNGFPSPADKLEKETAKLKKQQILEIIGELKENEQLKNQLFLIRLLPSLDSTRSLLPVMGSLSYLLIIISAQLKVVFRNLAATDFIEISQAALQALGDEDEPTDLALQLDYQIRHILVDEFQDTAKPQLTLLQKVTAGWQADDGRTLFIVGDGMQSCYGFRNANVGLFLQARRQGIGSVPLTPIDLQVNFRSQTAVVDWVNQTFAQAFPENDDIGRGAVKYSSSVAFKPALNGIACSTNIVTVDEQGDTKSAAIRQAALVVEQIKNIKQAASEDNIAILVRNRSHLKEVLPALQNAGIAWQATDIDPLASRMVITDLMSLCRAMLFPADRVAWLSFLRSPLVGLDLYELWMLTNLDPDTQSGLTFLDGFRRPLLAAKSMTPSSWDNFTANSKRRLSQVQHLIFAAQADRERKPLRIWLEGLWLALGGPSTLLNPADQENVESFFELLAQQGYTLEDWPTFSGAVDRLYAKPSADADPLVQVMTIHKSKGLEFDHVIIPGLEKQPRANENQLLLWQQRVNHHGQSDLLLAPLPPSGESKQPLYQLLAEEEKLTQDFEATRLLYVGCTRAIKHLHLFASVKLDTKAVENSDENTATVDTLATPGKRSLLAKIWGSVKNQATFTPLDTTFITSSLSDNDSASENTKLNVTENADNKLQANEPHISNHYIVRLSSKWKAPAQPQNQLLSACRGLEIEAQDNTTTAYHSEQVFYRHVGTILHRALRQITLDKTQDWGSSRRQVQQAIWQSQLQQLGLWPSGAEHGAALINSAVERVVGHDTGQWLLDNDHQESHCELRLWRGGSEFILDRCFVDNGTRWIVDYKSSLPAPEQSHEEFIQHELAAYEDQLQNYQRLAAELGDEPVKTALYFPMLQHLEVFNDS